MDQAAENNIAILIFTGIIGMLLLVVAIVIFFVMYQRRLFAQQQNIRQMELEHQKESLASIIEGQEVERKRIAQELHDGIGALLSATKLYVNKLPAAEQSTKDIGFIKTEALGLIDETIDNIRTITRDLLPTSLERFGLIAAIEDLCKRINDLKSLKINFEFINDKRIDIQKEFALYRILQELINNTLKYSEADQVEINLNVYDKKLEFYYKDNGKGLDLDAWRNSPQLQKGLGLKGIQSRADILNAKLNMESGVNKGFFISLELDL